MAINVNTLPAYVEEHRLPLIRTAVLGAKSAELFQLMTDVKGDTAMNILSTTVKFADGATCGFNDPSTSELSQRIIHPGYIKVQAEWCDKTLLKKWTQYAVEIGANRKSLPFEEDFVNGVLDQIKQNVEVAIWQGDKTKAATDPNLGQFDGLIKTIGAAAGVIKTTFSEGATITSIVNDIYAKIPTKAYSKGEVCIFMGTDSYRKLVQEYIANSNIVVTNAVNDVAMPDSMLMPGTNCRIYGVPGLDNTDKFFGSYKDNFVYATDLMSNSETFDLWYSQDNRSHRMEVSFVAGADVQFPDLVVMASKNA